MKAAEKRKHRRFPVITQIGEPVKISIEGKEIPGAIIDLSAGGIALLTYANVEVGTNIKFNIDIPGLKTSRMTGKVVRVAHTPKGNMWFLSINISSITSKDFDAINEMANDFNDCQKKILLGVPDVCFAECTYYRLCEKTQKIKKK